MNQKFKTAYLAAEGYEDQLLKEVSSVALKHGRLFLTEEPNIDPFFAQNIWLDPMVFHFTSISEAALILKNIQRNWALYSFTEHRRATLIKSKLPYVLEKPLHFPTPILKHELGSWTLLDKHTLIASPHCSSRFANGEIFFEECKIGPPSRAYLKLWEAFTLLGKMPDDQSRCLEIGASPGGWTWVLASLKAKVISVDRSELAENVAKMEGVYFKKGDAFAMTPSKVGPVDWIFSDVACYPEKLLEWVNLWIASGLCKNFICTLKFQGDPSYRVVDEFLKIPGSHVVHLTANKHELTWMLA